MLKHLPIMSLMLAVIALNACTNIHRNNALTPPAYKYHDQDFKSNEGQSARDIGYTYSRTINRKSLEVWDNIAYDLVSQMEKHFNMVRQPIYLQPHKQNTLFLNSYDYALRKELLKRGYDLVHNPKGVANLYYEAEKLKFNGKSIGHGDFQDVEFKLTIAFNGVMQQRMYAVHTLPSFYRSYDTSPNYIRSAQPTYSPQPTQWPSDNGRTANQNNYGLAPAANPSPVMAPHMQQLYEPVTPRAPTQLVPSAQVPQPVYTQPPAQQAFPYMRQDTRIIHPATNPYGLTQQPTPINPYPPAGYKRSTE